MDNHKELMSQGIYKDLLIIAFICFMNIAFADSESTAIDYVQSFYKGYLDFKPDPKLKMKSPVMDFSKPFKSEIEKNAKICKKYSSEICGFGADSDVYLDTQETDPTLNYTNSRINFLQEQPGIIIVTLNVYPSETNNRKFYDKKIIYSLVKEAGAWKVDDISYGEKTWRKMLKEENEWYLKNPDPDSAFMKSKKNESK